jgi:hypothetical protein
VLTAQDQQFESLDANSKNSGWHPGKLLSNSSGIYGVEDIEQRTRKM